MAHHTHVSLSFSIIHMKQENNNGCGCLGYIIFIIIGIIFSIAKDCGSKHESQADVTTSTNQPRTNQALDYNSQTGGNNNYSVRLSAEDSMYLDNTLSTGSTPYSNVYGKNYKCKTGQCSGINVTAPKSSDIIVIIKKNNSDGDVISHAYICKGKKYTFDLPDGTYQPFFYYGTGWNPEKDMGNGVKGGFVKDELFSKDEPQEIYQCIISYVLQLQHNGNFQTQRSNQAEIF